MYNPSTQGIIIFIAGVTLLLLVFIGFIVTTVYKYQQRQYNYIKNFEALKISHQNALLQSQLEIQEQTFQNISREIHDNIGQKLTLAKLYLNTLNYFDTTKTTEQVNNSVNIISEVINDLSDLSHSLSSEIILNNGLIKALEFEVSQLIKSGIYKINFSATGDTIFLHADTELVVFRIVQEALNNIVKHADASEIHILLQYGTTLLTMQINDNGRGFLTQQPGEGTGLHNIKKRTAILKGNLEISSSPNSGTKIKIEIPFYASNSTM